jgi:predicted deacylase
VANPLALGTLTRNTPVDSLDLNRLFPGAADGWLGEQMAWAISQEFLAHLDAYIDVHAGGVFPWVDYCYLLNDEGLSRAFLSHLLYTPAQMFAGATAAFAVNLDIPTSVIEIGGGYHDQESHIHNGVLGLTNQLRHLEVLEGTADTRAGQVLLHDMKVMRPRHGGLCVPQQALPPGTTVPGGTVLAEIVSPYTFEVLETLSAPYDTSLVVLSRNYITRVQPGDYAFMIGDGVTATRW